MDRSTRRDLIVLFAGLLGVAIGYALRSMHRGEDDEDGNEAQMRAITIPSVVGAVSVANRAAGMLPIQDDDVIAHAVLAASAGALLAYFAHGLGRMLPRLASNLR